MNGKPASRFLTLALGLGILSLYGGSAVGKSKPPGNDLQVDTQLIERRIQALSRFGENPEGGVSRVAFGEADIEGRGYIISLMREAGLEVRVDDARNILGRRAGRGPDLRTILFGSHIDSVPKGGNYDGDVGVIGAIECAQVLKEA